MAQTPTDPTKAQVWITKGIDDLDFEFYFPQGPKGDPGGITLGTALSTANLNDIKAPGVYRQDSGTPATLLNNYPVAATGVLYVDDRLGGGSSVMQTFYPFTGSSGIQPRRFYKRYLVASTTWGIWECYSANRVDQTAGRAIYAYDDLNARDQLIYGDTGWRKVVVEGGVTTQPNLSVYARRVGQQVSFTTIEHTGGGATTTATTIYTIPSGFRPNTGQTNPAMIFSGTVVDEGAMPIANTSLYAISAGANTLVLKPASAKRHYAVISYPTNDPWPTTLPGTAVGTIPNL